VVADIVGNELKTSKSMAFEETPFYLLGSEIQLEPIEK